MIGHIKIYKKEDNYETLLYESKNAISDGAARALTSLFTSNGSKDVSDYQVGYYQLGVGSLSGYLPSRTQWTNFYSLGSSLSENQYGNSSIYGPVILNQLVSPNGNFIDFTDLTSTSAAFMPLSMGAKSEILGTGFSVRINVDVNLANGVGINEVGIFIKNPTGASNTDEPILLAYKTFPTIEKNNSFSLIIDWKIAVKDEYFAQQNSIEKGVDSTEFEIITIDLTSGTDNISNQGTGTDLSDRFEMLIPSSFAATGAPLLIVLHGAGQRADTYRLSTTIPTEINTRNWFCLSPFGKSTVDIKNNTANGLYPHSKANENIWPSRTAVNHIDTIVRYVIRRYPIDKNRIYIYGFGEGGGCAMHYASQKMDLSASSWRPAAVISHSAPLNSLFSWWYNAPSSLVTANPNIINWPTPSNALMTSAGKAQVFYTATSGTEEMDAAQVSCIPAELTETGANGPGFSSISGVTPDHRLYRYWENNVVNFNLTTSTANIYDLSACTLRNLTHLPMYIHWVTNDPSGPVYYLSNNILSGILVNSGIPFIYSLNPSATGTHNLSTINLSAALNYCSNQSLSAVTAASTVITRSGRYWYFDLNNYQEIIYDHTNTDALSIVTAGVAASGLLSGLASIPWSINQANNELWVSGDRYVYDDSNRNMTFYPDLAGFKVTESNPLKIYSLSSHPDYPVGYPHPTASGARRITLEGWANPYQITFYDQTNAVGQPVTFGSAKSVKLAAAGQNWITTNGQIIAQQNATNPVNLVVQRIGKIEIVRYADG